MKACGCEPVHVVTLQQPVRTRPTLLRRTHKGGPFLRFAGLYPDTRPERPTVAPVEQRRVDATTERGM